MSNWTKLMDRSPPRVQLLLRGHLVTLENVLKALSHPIAGSYHGFEPNSGKNIIYHFPNFY